MHSFLLEIGIGLLLPFLILVMPGASGSPNASFIASTMVVIVVVINRINVSMVGITIPGQLAYIPALWEVLISVGTISTGIMLYYIICSKLPVFERR